MISVITVCRNAADVIRPCIDSVNTQTFGPLEHIIIDGASSDGTQARVEESRRCSGSRLSQFISTADGGIYDAMNKGVRLARGHYVYFLNADDRFFSPDTVQAVARELEQRRVSILQTRIVLHDAVSGAGSLFAPPRGLRRTSPLFRGIYQQSIWAARALFDTHGVFDISLRYCADVEWLMRVLKTRTAIASSAVLTTVFLLGGASSDFERVKAEQRVAELRHYSRLEWIACKTARRIARPLEALARSLQA